MNDSQLRSWADRIETADRDATNVRNDLLEKAGWRYTCEIGALWLWTREHKGKQIYVSTDVAVNLTLQGSIA